MKKYLITLLIILVNIISYGKSRVENYYDLEKRDDGLFYINDEKNSYTGEIVFKEDEILIKKEWYHKGELEKEEGYYENGNIKWKSTAYKNGKLDGLSKRFYEDGTLMIETIYKNGIKDGLEKGYSENGKIVAEILYKNNMINGFLKRYDDEGDIYLEENYKNDILHGITKIYSNGKLIEEREYRNGTLIKTKNGN